MAEQPWHERLVGAIRAHLVADARVLGLAVVGSLAGDGALADEWSDLDLLVIAADTHWPYPPAHEWLGRVAPLYGWETHETPAAGGWVTRAYLADGHRVDVVLAAERVLHSGDRAIGWMLRSDVRVVFSRSAALDGLLGRPPHPPADGLVPEPDLATLAAGFRFRALLAVGRIVRSDLLMASDLAHRLAMDCCLAAMLLRDRQTGTDHHRRGRPDEPYDSLLPAVPGSPTQATLLDAIEAISQAFWRLWSTLSGEEAGDDRPLADAIRRAREAVARQG